MSMFIALAVHILAAVIWVGGMFFAYMILRPSLPPLEPSNRLPVWQRVFARFFPWVWLCVVALPASGVTMVSDEFGGFSTLSPYVQLMMVLGGVMIAIFLFLYFVPWRRYRAAVAAADWGKAESHIRRIRLLVGINLLLGLAEILVGAGGRFY
ncbi:MAG TPA: CopD family protein [Steroidobacteraceae bacterium]